jgi:hypothetical protein
MRFYFLGINSTWAYVRRHKNYVAANITPGFGDYVSSRLFSHFSTQYYLTDQAKIVIVVGHLSSHSPHLLSPQIDRSIVDQMVPLQQSNNPLQVSTKSPMLVRVLLLPMHWWTSFSLATVAVAVKYVSATSTRHFHLNPPPAWPISTRMNLS